MSWHYSQAQVEESSVDICSDGEPFVQSNKNLTASAFCSKDKMTRFSRLSRFGMTFAHLTEDRGEELLTLYLEGFHARTSQQPGKAQELKEKEVDSGVRWQESLGKLNRNGSLQKTHQCLFPEDSISSSPILPKWGLMLDGELLEQTMSEQITKENASGLSQETWPTPRASSAMNDKQETCLKRIKKMGYEGKLEQAVTMWPTPTATEARQGYQDRTRGKKGTQKSLTTEVIDKEGGREKTGGQLCPIFVEYLMGWPLGHTDLKRLEMDKYQQWLELHGRH